MPDNAFTIAYKYHTLGRCILPSGGGADGKAALTPWKRYQTERPTDEQVENWQRELNPTVWAMITGSVSGCFVIDCDTKEAIAIMEAAQLKPHDKTKKGYHYYCQLPSWTIPTKVGILPGIDIRGQGGYVNFCGKNDKVAYEVLTIPIDETLITFEQLPVELQKALKPKPKTLADQILQEALSRAQPGNRNETGFWLACQLRDNSIPQANAEAIIRSYVSQVGNIGSEPYTEQEALATLEQAYKQPAREPSYSKQPDPLLSSQPEPDKLRYTLSDTGNAERLADQCKGLVHYVREQKHYIVYNGKRWEHDISGAKMMAFAKKAARAIYQEASSENNDDRRIKLAAHARTSEGDQKRKAMISCLMSEPGIEISTFDLDTDPFLLNCPNGTIDLRTGELRAHDKADYITQITPVDYKPEATSEAWETVLQEIFDGKQKLIDYIQQAIGYSATGSQEEMALFFCHGSGWNGKSTFLGAIQDTLGTSYAVEVQPSVFMVQQNKGSGPDDLAAMLYKKRFARSTETEEGQKLSVTQIKAMTGGEEIPHNRKYEHAFNYRPTHKLWFSGNHEPTITDTTDSIWLRLKKTPFTITFTPEKRNPHLREELFKNHREAILAWIVKGCLKWQGEKRLVEPEEITIATNQYRQKQDRLAEYLKERCKLEISARETVAIIFKTYKQWCEDNDTYWMNKLEFNNRLEEKGLVKKPGAGNKTTWHGIRLLTPQDSMEKEGENNPPKLTICSQVVNSVNSIPRTPLIETTSKVPRKDLTDLTDLTKLTISEDADRVVHFEDTVDIKAFNRLLPCPTCGGTKFWLRPDGARVCNKCHPKPGGKK